MARTPLLRSLFELARDHAEAEHHGTTPAAVRSQRAVNRRDFLATIGAGLAATTLMPKSLFAGSNAPRIAIVGGGISGLACALELADAGLVSSVYEAKGRVGGRMFSDNNGKYWADGQVAEWCGELIDTNHTSIRKLCKRFSLPMDDLLAAQPAKATETYFVDGGYYTNADADFDVIRPIVKADLEAAGYPTAWNSYTPAGLQLDKMSVHQWIASRVPGGLNSPLGKLLDVAYVIEYGSDSKDQSALNLLYMLGYQPKMNLMSVFGESDERFHIRGGNQLLPEAIAAVLPKNAVNFGFRLNQLVRNPDGTFTMHFKTAEGTKTVVADAVVLSLPFAVLRTLDYTKAGFDSRKNSAIQDMGRGQNGKLMAQFDARPWTKAGPWGISSGSTFTNLGYQASWEVSRAQAGSSGILVGYSGGSGTSAGLKAQASPYTRANDATTNALAGKFVKDIGTVFPGLANRWKGKASLAIPHKDADFLCSYSYYRVGQYTAFGGYQGERQGRCFFAGEHCSADFQGFMEGGATEGQRAAAEIVAAYS